MNFNKETPHFFAKKWGVSLLRGSFNMSLIQSPSFFFVRLPRQPISQLLGKLNQTHWPTNSTQELLRTFLVQPGVEEALYLASASLFSEWQTFCQNPKATLKANVESGLWKYIFRLHSRSTPFGLFSGVGQGKIETQTRVDFGESPWQPISQSDSTILVLLCQFLQTRPAIRKQLRYRLNNSLYNVGGSIRFSERQGYPNQTDIDLVEVECLDALRTIIQEVQDQPDQYINQIIATLGLPTDQESQQFIDQLINAQLLNSQLNLPVTGQTMTENLLAILADIPEASTYYSQLVSIHELLSSESVSLTMLQTATNKLLKLINEVETVNLPSPPLQTNLFFYPKQLSLNQELVASIGRQLISLLPLRDVNHFSPLEKFKEAFYSRYQDQEVPLLVALDNELGIGYGNDPVSESTLLKKIKEMSLHRSFIEADRLDGLRQVVYNRFLLSQNVVVHLTDEDLQKTESIPAQPPLPASFFALGELYKSPTSPVNKTEGKAWQFLLKTVGGPSAANLVGRFCHGSQSIYQAARELCDWEASQYPEEILAEIIHLPSARAGNIVSRPLLRDYEIPYLSSPGVVDKFVIPLADLQVSVIQGQQIVLRSKRHNKIVRPRLTCAHDVTSSDLVYRFLSELIRQETIQLNWSWGYLSEQPKLPRLTYKNLILSRAQWFLQEKDFREKVNSLRQLQDYYQLPRYVVLANRDNELLLDLCFPPAGQILFEEFQKKSKIRLLEWIAQPDTCWITDKKETYVSEFIIPFTSVHTQSLTARNSFFTDQSSKFPLPTRTFIPGSQWLYLKLYCSPQTGDSLLTTYFLPLWQQAQIRGWCDLGFFVRYADPDFHLRVRFRCFEPFQSNLFTQWYQTLHTWVDNGMIHRIELDTYDRELERYEPTLMESFESIFSADSSLVVQWLSELEMEPTDDLRLLLALNSVDDLLDQFGYSLSQKSIICRQLQEDYWQEHGARKEIRHSLNSLYREWTKGKTLFSPEWEKLFAQRNLLANVSFLTIQQYFKDYDALHVRKLKVVKSLLHMALNRIFTAQFRKHELVVYHFLARYYEASIAQLENS
jgi:thiopeptide-type bacteriocin biosynthesis protein